MVKSPKEKFQEKKEEITRVSGEMMIEKDKERMWDEIGVKKNEFWGKEFCETRSWKDRWEIRWY